MSRERFEQTARNRSDSFRTTEGLDEEDEVMKNSVSQERAMQHDQKAGKDIEREARRCRRLRDFLYGELLVSVAKDGQEPKLFTSPMPGKLFEDWCYRPQRECRKRSAAPLSLFPSFSAIRSCGSTSRRGASCNTRTSNIGAVVSCG